MEVKLCKTCAYWSAKAITHGSNSEISTSCNNDKLSEDRGQEKVGDELIYSYYEGGWFEPGPNFGCIHWKAK